MKKLGLSLFLIAVAVLAAFVLYFSLGTNAPATPAPSLSPVELPTTPSSDAKVEPTDTIAPASKDLTAIADSPTQRATIQVDPGLGLPPEKRCTLSVSVAMPAGAPADDGPELLVIGKVDDEDEVEESLARLVPGDPLPKWLIARTQLSPSGPTEIILERSSLKVSVALYARYSFAETVSFVEISGERATAQLKATLGACVRGRLIPPSDATSTERDLAGAPVQVRSDPFAIGSPMDGTKTVSRKSVCTAEGRFELRGIAAIKEITLSGTPPHLAAFKALVHDLAAGKLVDIEVPLEHGVLVSGKVLDESDSPVAGAKIEVRADAVMWGKGGRVLRKGKSEADGTFKLEAIAAGKAMVDVTAEGHLETTTNFEFFEGKPVTDLVLRVEGGTRLAGTVVWADGTPAASVEVKVTFDPAHMIGMEALNAMRGAGAGGKTNELGEFSIGGLGKGPFLVTSSGVPPGAGEGSEGEDALRSTAEIANVQPGTLDLRLSLAPPSDVSGRVVDDVGAPVVECTVVISRSTKNPWIPGEGDRDAVVANPEGSFSAKNVSPGHYSAKAHVKLGPTSPPLSFEMPRAQDAGELVLTLPRPATVSGRVLLPDGTPAAGAQVHQQLSVFDMQRGMLPGSEPSCTTGEDGTFTTTAMPMGSISISAKKDGYAPSDPMALKLEPTTVIADLVLNLRIGGTITGEAYGADGRPKAGATILAQMPDLKFGQVWAKTDANGKFEYRNVAPGQWQVMLLAFDAMSGGDSAGAEPDDKAKAISNFMDQMKIAMANVKEGGTVHVLLGAPVKDPVHLRCRVSAAKAGVSGVMVSFLPTDGAGEKGTSLSSMKLKTTDDDGRFEIDLDHSGSYLVSVQRIDMQSGAQQSVEFARTIPDGPECSLELELPLGSIRGRVLGANGDPLPQARISLNVEGPTQAGTLTGGRFSETRTDSSGEFALDWLAPGTYTVSAGGQSMTMADFLSDTIVMGRQVRGGIHVSEGERVDGVEFRLKTACELNGKVFDADGKPIAEVNIFLRDEEGRPVDHISVTSTDANGHFHQTGLSAGRYTVSARSAALVSSETNVVVRDGEPSEVELHLTQGTMLIVTVTDKDDAPVQVSLSVTDEKGRQVNGLYSLSDLMRTFSEGNFDAKKPRVGPLAPGKYQVTAITSDGTKLNRSVTLIGQAERKLTLKLDK